MSHSHAARLSLWRIRVQHEQGMPFPVNSSILQLTTQAQNVSLNRLLNQATELSQRSPYPIKFYRAQHTDSFHGGSGRDGKVRVSRDRAGRIVENGVIRKRRLGDLNVFSPREAFDWRVSVNVEEPCESDAVWLSY